MAEFKSVANIEGQSHSIGVVRWNLPEETVEVHSSAPTSPYKNSNSTSSRTQVNTETIISPFLLQVNMCFQSMEAHKGTAGGT